MNYNEAYAYLEPAGQTHLLKYYDELDAAGKEQLLTQIAKLDLSVLDLIKDEGSTAGRGKFEPLDALTVKEIENDKAKYTEAGIKAIQEGKTAAVLLAGGQGTRLGFDKPKGMFNVGLTHDLYIFECLINNLMDVVKEAGAYIPLYIMTSEINNDDTVNFFNEKNFFGYDPSYVKFFVQDMAPAVSFEGKVLMDSKSTICYSPNGNGGWYSSLVKAGLDADLRARNIEYISVFAVDNVCQRINDPAFVGATILSGCECSGKVVAKANPNERVGVLCQEDGKPSIVEYYEMTDEMINLRKEDGTLAYNYGVILNYMFKLSALDEIVRKALPTHVVRKKVPHIAENGEFVKPEEPNAFKFEQLVLDMVHLMASCLPYEVVRSHEFSPIKNPTGVDSVESARELLKLNGVEL